MKFQAGDYVLLSNIKDVDELNAVHDALVAGSGIPGSFCYPYSDMDYQAIHLTPSGVGKSNMGHRWLKRRLTVDQVLGRTPSGSYIVMDGTVEVVEPMSYENACYHAREYAKANPDDAYTVCNLCRVFRGRVEVDESEYGEGE